MVDRQRDIAVLEERDQVVEILQRDPPVETMTGLRVLAIFSISNQSFRSELAILMIGNAELAAEVDRLLVERRGHGDAGGLADGFDQRGEVVLGQLRVERFLDVANVGAMAEILVDESVDVAELELDRGADVVESGPPGRRC